MPRSASIILCAGLVFSFFIVYADGTHASDTEVINNPDGSVEYFVRHGFENDNDFIHSWTLGRYSYLRHENPVKQSVNNFLVGVNNTLGTSISPDQVDVGWGMTTSYYYDSSINNKIDLSLKAVSRWYSPSRRFYVTIAGGVAYNELKNENTGQNELELGGNGFFATDTGTGVMFSVWGQPASLGYHFIHRSNGGLANENQSLNFHTLQLSSYF